MVLVKKFGFKGKHKIQDRWENQIYEVLESCHSSPLVFRIRKEDGTGKTRVLHRNLLLPFRSRILEEEIPPLSPDPVDDNQFADQVESIQENQEDSSEDEQSSQSDSDDDDDKSVPARPWTRSQGPPPALVGTRSAVNSHSPPGYVKVHQPYYDAKQSHRCAVCMVITITTLLCRSTTLWVVRL